MYGVLSAVTIKRILMSEVFSDLIGNRVVISFQLTKVVTKIISVPEIILYFLVGKRMNVFLRIQVLSLT